MSRKKRKRVTKVAAGVNGAVVIHQPTPYAGTDVRAADVPRGQPAAVYHGDIEAIAPVVPSTVAGSDPARRATAVDALRGLFLLSMTLGFTIQPEIFATWMYHRQFPPPGHDFLDVAGIGWRDVTYGAFLFSMAAAVPITLARRIARGTPELGIMGAALRRGFMLFLFALIIGHTNPFFIGEYTQRARAIAVVGFLLTFLVFTRPRADWNQQRWATIQKWGWVAIIAFLALTPLIYGRMFSLARRDDIIAALAFAAVTGWIIWYFTRRNIPVRLAILAGVTALFAAAQQEGPVQQFWFSSPLPWLWVNSSLVLLCVVIPGTIAGDLILRWMNDPAPDTPAHDTWKSWRSALLLVLTLAATPILVVGIYNRQVMETSVGLAAVCGAALLLSWKAATPTERLVRGLVLWGSAWLALGMALEPLYGGMRKVPDNLSYYFAMAGVSTMLLTALTIVTDLMRSKRAVRFLTDVGQNPMLCYILFSVFLNSIFEMIPAMRGWLRDSPEQAMLRSALTVLLVGLITREFTRRRIFWRA